MEARLRAAIVAEQKPQVGIQRPEAGGQSAEEPDSETEVAAKIEPIQSNEVNGAPPPDEEGFVWPEGSAPTGATVANESAPDDERAPDTPLPSLDELVKRIPNAAREVLDELFRAKFVSVKRVEKNALKN